MKNIMHFLSWRLMFLTTVLLFLMHFFVFMSCSKLDEKVIACDQGNKMRFVIYNTLSTKVMIGYEDFRQLFYQPLRKGSTAVMNAELLGSMFYSSSVPVITRRLRIKDPRGHYIMIGSAI